MRTSVMDHAADADAIIMAAAVADYTVQGGARPEKVSKDLGTLTLTLTRTRDILAELGQWRADRTRPVLVGFAAETHDVVTRAQAKLDAKRVDLMVANDVSRTDAGFEVETNVTTFVEKAGSRELPLLSKREVAHAILERIEALLRRQVPTETVNVDDAS